MSNSHWPRNEVVGFDASWINHVRVNRAAAERRAASLVGAHTLKGQYRAAWLLKAISLIDLTTLGGDDTPGRVERLCKKALQPLRLDLMAALGVAHLSTGAVCVYHQMIGPAQQALALAGSNLPIAAVSTGFPAGLSSLETRLREIELSVAAGATEIDIVITRQHALTGNWQTLYDETLACRRACGDAHLKTILATGDLETFDNIAKASWVCMMAGADFIKTSTGKEGVNATLPVALVMVRAIREYHQQTGLRVGFKPAGGVSSASSALHYMTLMKEELGRAWLEPQLFRIGASSLLTDIECQLEHHVSGHYSSARRHALP